MLIFGGIIFYKIIEQPVFLIETVNFIGGVLTPFWIGLFLAIISNPIVKKLQKKFKLNRGISILLTYLGGILVLGAVITIILPTLISGINDLFIEMTGYINKPDQWFNDLKLDAPYVEEMMLFLKDNFQNISQHLMGILNGVSTKLLVSIVGVTSQIFNIIFGITISIYLLIDQEKVTRAFRQFLKVYLPKKAKKIDYFVTYTYHMFQDYIVGRLLDSLIIGIIAYVGFYLLKSPFVSLFAFIIFITNIIPYFGPIIGAIPPILMTLIMDPIQAVWVGLFILFLQQLDGNVIGPKIMGDKVGLSPLWVISAVILGGALFGFIGFFLAVPVAAVMKEIYDKSMDEKLAQFDKKKPQTTIFE